MPSSGVNTLLINLSLIIATYSFNKSPKSVNIVRLEINSFHFDISRKACDRKVMISLANMASLLNALAAKSPARP